MKRYNKKKKNSTTRLIYLQSLASNRTKCYIKKKRKKILISKQ